MKRWIATALVAALTACGSDADDADMAADTSGTGAAMADVPASPMTISDIGLQTPESVLYDDRADLYLVSNINGEPLARDGNGFIARLRPNGEVEQLKWIDGAADGVTLHAPKGMGFRGDTLFIADIDTVRSFHRDSGAPLGARGIDGASFLNDIAIGDDGVYVTDTGVDASFSPTGTDAIYRFGAEVGSGAGDVGSGGAGGIATVASGGALSQPNGIVVHGGDIYMVPFGSNVVYVIRAAGGEPREFATLPAGQLDGIVRLDDGSLLVSSWEGGAVYRVSAGGDATVVFDGLEAPADIGWDSRRQRVLIPLFMGNAIEIREVR
ncbi:hypothetical protein BH23GEM10_BH23GEM10_02970 [soil metagenome]